MANLRKRHRLSREELNMEVGMLVGGRSQPQLARALGVSQSTVSRMWNRYQTYGDVTHRHWGGRQRPITQAEDRFLVIQAQLTGL